MCGARRTTFQRFSVKSPATAERSLRRDAESSLCPAGAIVCCSIQAQLSAQDLDNVTISGKVTDQNGAVIPGATITATLVATKAERTVVADADGNYKLIQLPPGVYNVKASFTNFAAEEKTNLADHRGTERANQFHAEAWLESTLRLWSSALPTPLRSIPRARSSAAQLPRVKLTRCPTIRVRLWNLIFTLGGVSEEALSTRDLANDRAEFAHDARGSRHVFNFRRAGVFQQHHDRRPG